MEIKIGVVDTMFARVNMGAIALDEIKADGDYKNIKTIRKTVPGIKDLAPECKKLLQECDICIALGMVGGAHVDLQCAHEASLGIMQVKVATNKHILEIFAHENEAWSEKEFYAICEDRIRKHVRNAILLIKNPNELIKYAGKGIRQGKEDEGEICISKNKPIELGFVVSEFNKNISSKLLKHALEKAEEKGAIIKIITKVPGVFEIPLVVKKLLFEKKIDAIVTLGYVKKGETQHDKIIAENCSKAIMHLSLEYRKPISLGIITIADAKQAEKRVQEYAERAVLAAITMVEELKK